MKKHSLVLRAFIVALVVFCAGAAGRNAGTRAEANLSPDQINEIPGDSYLGLSGLIRVDGGSMNNTVESGEVISVAGSEYGSNWAGSPNDSNNEAERAPRYIFGTPEMLDVVFCRFPGRGPILFLMRIAGMPGDLVELRDGYLYINGEQVAEEKEIEGIADEYRLGFQSTKPCYVPKKGDKAVLRWTDSNLTIDVNEISGWNRNMSCVVMKAGEKPLKVFDRNIDESSRESNPGRIQWETVISYDGIDYSPEAFFDAFPEINGQELSMDEDYYFVMGDHRNNSRDSRSIGVLERSAIIRRAVSVVMPLSRMRNIQ